MTDRVEHDFLLFVSRLLRGPYPGPGRRPLRTATDGLAVDEEGRRPLRRALEERIAKVVLGELAQAGGMEPRRYVVGDRLRTGALLAPPVWDRVGPLCFTMASFQLLEVLHDHRLEELPEELPLPGSLGDELVFDRVCRSLDGRAPPRLLRSSPFTELTRARAGVALPRLADLPASQDASLLLRSQARHLAAAWRREIQRAWRLPPARQGERVAALGAVLGTYLDGIMESRRHGLLTAYLRLYRRLIREVRRPEDVLSAAAEAAGSFRKVSEKERFLRAHASLYRSAKALQERHEEILATPNMEREEEDRLFHDEYQDLGRELVPRVEALHRTLDRRLGG